MFAVIANILSKIAKHVRMRDFWAHINNYDNNLVFDK